MTQELKKLKETYQFLSAGDQWGDCMGTFFDVAEYLHYDTVLRVPDRWHFHPGLGKHISEYWQETFDDVRDTVVLKFGEILHRYSNILRAQGEDY